MERSIIQGAVGRLAFVAIVAVSPWFSRAVAKEAMTTATARQKFVLETEPEGAKLHQRR